MKNLNVNDARVIALKANRELHQRIEKDIKTEADAGKFEYSLFFLEINLPGIKAIIKDLHDEGFRSWVKVKQEDDKIVEHKLVVNWDHYQDWEVIKYN